MSIRMRHTRGHTGNRRSHHALKNMRVVTDAKSGNLVLPHHLDEATGMYNGMQIFTPKAKAIKEPKAKALNTEPKAENHKHEHAQHEHANAEAKGLKRLMGKVATGGRPKARSGMGGQVSKGK